MRSRRACARLASRGRLANARHDDIGNGSNWYRRAPRPVSQVSDRSAKDRSGPDVLVRPRVVRLTRQRRHAAERPLPRRSSADPSPRSSPAPVGAEALASVAAGAAAGGEAAHAGGAVAAGKAELAGGAGAGAGAAAVGVGLVAVASAVVPDAAERLGARAGAGTVAGLGSAGADQTAVGLVPPSHRLQSVSVWQAKHAMLLVARQKLALATVTPQPQVRPSRWHSGVTPRQTSAATVQTDWAGPGRQAVCLRFRPCLAKGEEQQSAFAVRGWPSGRTVRPGDPAGGDERHRGQWLREDVHGLWQHRPRLPRPGLGHRLRHPADLVPDVAGGPRGQRRPEPAWQQAGCPRPPAGRNDCSAEVGAEKPGGSGGGASTGPRGETRRLVRVAPGPSRGAARRRPSRCRSGGSWRTSGRTSSRRRSRRSRRSPCRRGSGSTRSSAPCP